MNGLDHFFKKKDTLILSSRPTENKIEANQYLLNSISVILFLSSVIHALDLNWSIYWSYNYYLQVNQIEFNQLGQTLSQKEKGQFIKEYIDNCEGILKKNKMGQKELRKYGRAVEKGKGQHYYNESVVNKISIKNVYVVKEVLRYEDELLIVQEMWKNAVMKSQKDLVSLINRKK